jgi:hypothetical protein
MSMLIKHTHTGGKKHDFIAAKIATHSMMFKDAVHIISLH